MGGRVDILGNIIFIFIFFIELKPGSYGLWLFLFVCRGEKRLVETHLYVWQGFVAKNCG